MAMTYEAGENMSNDIFVITEHMDGAFSDVSLEMVGKAKEIAAAFGGQAIAVVLGSGVSASVRIGRDDPRG
jgi:electron transfer flavoprotein alpha subunit